MLTGELESSDDKLLSYYVKWHGAYRETLLYAREENPLQRVAAQS